MKKYFTWKIMMTVILLSASVLFYIIHYMIFRDVQHIFIFMIGDMAFLFLDVLLVVLFIEQVLSRREKKVMMEKLNMVIGAFFSEVGNELLKKFSVFIENSSQLEKKLDVKPSWSHSDFKQAIREAANFSYEVKINKKALSELRDFLKSKREFLLRLLENPNLLEHDRFTDLLWAIFHLSEELSFRDIQIEKLPQSDYHHLAGDLKRAFSQITSEWVTYAEHLKENYPFLFSLFSRVNPMNPYASPIVS